MKLDHKEIFYIFNQIDSYKNICNSQAYMMSEETDFNLDLHYFIKAIDKVIETSTSLPNSQV